MKFSIKDFFINVTKSATADLVTFNEEILNGKLHFLCSMPLQIQCATFLKLTIFGTKK